MKIFISKEDISLGKSGDSEFCPVALALCRELKLDSKRIGVGDETIDVDEQIVKTPKKVKVFIHNFDNLLPVEPFTFNLKI